MAEPAYDSRFATLEHIGRVRELLEDVKDALDERARVHDASKLEEPEKSAFDRCTPLLEKTSYDGGPEYDYAKAELGDALAHHYAANRHHPEHWDPENGIRQMTLVDQLEMLADWKAATERHPDGDLRRSILINAERFNYDGQFADMLIRTASDLDWL